MRLVSFDHGLDISLSDESITVLTIEHPGILYEVLSGLWNAGDASLGTVLFEHNCKTINFSRDLSFILNPLIIDINSKKVITKLYQELNLLGQEAYIEELADINRKAISLIDSMSLKIPNDIVYNLEISFLDLLKVYDVKIDDASDGIERIINYIRVMHRICNVNLFVFYGIKHLFAQEQMEAFYKTVLNENVYLLLIENSYIKPYLTEINYVLDSDRCIIKCNEN